MIWTIAAACGVLGAGQLLWLLDAEREAARLEEHVSHRARAAESVEALLYEHARQSTASLLSDEPAASPAADRLAAQALATLATLRLDARDEAEAGRTEEVERAVAAYLQAHRATAARGVPVVESLHELQRPLDEALTRVRAMARANAARDSAVTTDTRARLRALETATYGAAALWVLGLVGAAGLLVRHLYRPLLQVRRAVDELGTARDAPPLRRGPKELQEIAHALQERARALERRRRAQLTALAAVAHDLKNPLAAVSLTLDRLARADHDLSRRQRAFEMLQRQVERMARLLEDLLDSARIEAGELSLDVRDCDPTEIARDVVALYENTSERHAVVLDAPRPFRMCADCARLSQVLANLVGNAIKYSPSGGSVRLAASADDDTALFEVHDEGVGIPAEEIDAVFEPYRRTQRGRDTAPGTGLGLAVAKRIVEAHGGTIQVESRPPRGSTFRVRLPRAGPPEPRSEA